jgi:hypothetical protein
VALVINWVDLFVRGSLTATIDREAITSRPLLLQAIGRQTSHAGRTTLTITSSHGEQHRARCAHPQALKSLCRLREYFSPKTEASLCRACPEQRKPTVGAHFLVAPGILSNEIASTSG